MTDKNKNEIIQIQHPVTKRWVKLNTKTGEIIDRKQTDGKYEDIPDAPIESFEV